MAFLVRNEAVPFHSELKPLFGKCRWLVRFEEPNSTQHDLNASLVEFDAAYPLKSFGPVQLFG